MSSSIISRMLSRFYPFSNAERRVLLLGNDASGKTTLLYQWKLGEVITTVPTIGFNVETIPHRSIDFTMWDVGGCDKIRPLWRHYFHNTQAIIFVIDSNDTERLDYNTSGFHMIFEASELDDAIILIMANKQDLPGALTPNEISDVLGLGTNFPGRQIHIQGCSASTRDGIMEGLDWLHDALLNRLNSEPSSSASQISPPPPPPTDGKKENVSESQNTMSASEQEAIRMENLLLEWLEREDIPAEDFLKKIEDATLDTWDHYTHLRIAWLHLTKYGRRVGMENIFSSIESFIQRSPRTKRSDTSRGTTFHVTMTYFWVHMVHFAMSTMQQSLLTENDKEIEAPDQASLKDIKIEHSDEELCTAFKHFLLMNPQLVNGGLFLHYYSKQRMLMNVEARGSVLLPDIRSLPSVLNMSSQDSDSDSKNVVTPVHLRLQPRAPLNDVDFLMTIKQHTFQSWGHDILIRLLYVVLRDQEKKNEKNDNPFMRDIDEIFDILRDIQGESFHFTLNYFWVQMVCLEIARNKKKTQNCGSENFETFYRQPDSQKLRNQLLYEKYYGKTAVECEEAKTSLVLPDLKQLPSVI